MEKNIWHAIVQVRAINDNNDLKGAKGAYVNVAYKASSKKEFIKTLKESFTKYDFEVLEIDDVEALTINNADNPEKLSLLEETEEHDFSWGDFHTYK